MKSGETYKIDTRRRSHGQDPKNFIETGYSLLLSASESEENHPENLDVMS